MHGVTPRADASKVKDSTRRAALPARTGGPRRSLGDMSLGGPNDVRRIENPPEPALYFRTTEVTMFLSFALFEAIDVTGRVESFLVFPTDSPTMIVDRLREVRGRSNDQQLDLGALRFYTDNEGLKVRRVVSQYGLPAFERVGDEIRLHLSHIGMPIPEGTVGYYSLLLPQDFCGKASVSPLDADRHWLEDTRRLLLSVELYDKRKYIPATSVHVHATLCRGVQPGTDVPRIQASDVYADWSSGPHHHTVRAFIRAANASLVSTARGVFICHSGQDKPFARTLAVALAGAGHKVWIDEAEIHVGESLIDKIESGIAGASHLIAIVSKASLASKWCREELKMALVRQIGARGITVLPVIIDESELPGFLQEKKYADFRQANRFDDAFHELVGSLNA